MTTHTSLCVFCKHLRRDVRAPFSCAAFPDRIPQAVYFNLDVHTAPVEGDHGIQFEPREDLTEYERQLLERLLQLLRDHSGPVPPHIRKRILGE